MKISGAIFVLGIWPDSSGRIAGKSVKMYTGNETVGMLNRFGEESWVVGGSGLFIWWEITDLYAKWYLKRTRGRLQLSVDTNGLQCSNSPQCSTVWSHLWNNLREITFVSLVNMKIPKQMFCIISRFRNIQRCVPLSYVCAGECSLLPRPHSHQYVTAPEEFSIYIHVYETRFRAEFGTPSDFTVIAEYVLALGCEMRLVIVDYRWTSCRISVHCWLGQNGFKRRRKLPTPVVNAMPLSTRRRAEK